ncbi:hypothetical protein ACJX0J_017089, partial [Zea mays]
MEQETDRASTSFGRPVLVYDKTVVNSAQQEDFARGQSHMFQMMAVLHRIQIHSYLVQRQIIRHVFIGHNLFSEPYCSIFALIILEMIFGTPCFHLLYEYKIELTKVSFQIVQEVKYVLAFHISCIYQFFNTFKGQSCMNSEDIDEAQASLERDDEVYSDLLFRFIVSSCIELNRLYLLMFDVFFWLLYLPQDVYFDDESTAGMHDEIEDDQFESIFVQADPVVTVDNLLEQVTDREITRQQSTDAMDEDVVEDHSETDGDYSNEHIEAVTTDKVPELKLIEDIFVQSDHAVAADNLPEQVRDCEITLETTSLIVDEKQQIMVTVDGDLVKDDSETDNVHDDEQMEVVTADEVLEDTGITVEDVEEKQKSTFTVDKDA